VKMPQTLMSLRSGLRQLKRLPEIETRTKPFWKPAEALSRPPPGPHSLPQDLLYLSLTPFPFQPAHSKPALGLCMLPPNLVTSRDGPVRGPPPGYLFILSPFHPWSTFPFSCCFSCLYLCGRYLLDSRCLDKGSHPFLLQTSLI